MKKILIVEDDYKLAREWQDELLDLGYAVDTVSSTSEAKLLLSNNYDCFILDLYHIKYNKFLEDGGIRSISIVRKHDADYHKRSLIIAVTGLFRSEKPNTISTEQVVKNLGADFVLQKPFDFSSIVEIIKKEVAIKTA